MRKIIEKIKGMDSHRLHHILMRIAVTIFALLVVYRFVSFFMMQNRSVVNLTRDANQNGAPVSVIEMAQTDGVIYEPLFIKANRGYVSGMRVGRFRTGQKITDGGVITSVAQSVDLDTGMYVVHTRGAADGAHTVEIREKGFYVPTYAVHNGNVFVVRDGVAKSIPVSVVRSDLDNAMITGVANGDVVITSNITDGALVKIIK
ncbi:MAG: hypothetical protein IJ866_01715 [Alphaproteobacteria bacterium]|nr:hypothetical protein [Alphaproteobacteria bacterium]